MGGYSAFFHALLVIWLLWCLIGDLRFRRLPNYLMLAGIVLAVLNIVIAGNSLIGATAMSVLMAMLLALVLTLPGYVLKLLGAGDVKMLSVIGLMTSLQFMLLSYAVAGLLAGLFVLYSILGHRYVPYINLQLAKLGWQMPATGWLNGKSLPFGALMAVGGLLTLFLHLTGMMNVVAAT